MRTLSRQCAMVCSWLLMGVSALRAGESMAKDSADQAFAKGRHEAQFGVGFAVSENYFSLERPQLNDADVSARLGWMLNSPMGPGIWRGNFEAVGEVFGGAVVKGPGHELVGMMLILRRNMIFRGACIVPYYQFGLGGLYSDAHKEHPQRILGSPLLFSAQAGFGARYLISPGCAVFLELDYRHISNAGLAERNAGLNSAVGWLGATCFF